MTDAKICVFTISFSTSFEMVFISEYSLWHVYMSRKKGCPCFTRQPQNYISTRFQSKSLAMDIAAIVPSATAVVICLYFLLITSPTA